MTSSNIGSPGPRTHRTSHLQRNVLVGAHFIPNTLLATFASWWRRRNDTFDGEDLWMKKRYIGQSLVWVWVRKFGEDFLIATVDALKWRHVVWRDAFELGATTYTVGFGYSHVQVFEKWFRRVFKQCTLVPHCRLQLLQGTWKGVDYMTVSSKHWIADTIAGSALWFRKVRTKHHFSWWTRPFHESKYGS